MDGDLMLKIVAGLAAVVSLWLDFRPVRRKQNPNPAIALANAGERHNWRYARWGIRTLQFLLGLYLLWMLIKFIVA